MIFLALISILVNCLLMIIIISLSVENKEAKKEKEYLKNENKFLHKQVNWLREQNTVLSDTLKDVSK